MKSGLKISVNTFFFFNLKDSFIIRRDLYSLCLGNLKIILAYFVHLLIRINDFFFYSKYELVIFVSFIRKTNPEKSTSRLPLRSLADLCHIPPPMQVRIGILVFSFQFLSQWHVGVKMVNRFGVSQPKVSAQIY